MPNRNLRSKAGATLGLVAVILLTVAMIGSCFFFLVRILGGSNQSMNATDAGALSAARTMVTISIPTTNLAPEFQGLGVNVHNGQPDSINGAMNIFAYNRAAGVATLIGMNAVQENTQTAIDNANTVIAGLERFGDALNTALIESGHLGNDSATTFQEIASRNNVNMMGSNSTVNIVNDLQFNSVPTGLSGSGGKANVYFNPASFNGDPFYTTLAPATQENTGSIASVAQPDSNAPIYASQPVFLAGQPLLKAYSAINLDQRLSPIFMAAVSPASQPHLIDPGRYHSGNARFGHAPVNALSGQTQTLESNKSNTNITHVACALVGSLFNEYPITLVHGYVRIHNGPDSRIANGALLPTLPASVDGTNNIFNNQLYAGPGGGGGIVTCNNGVFGTLWSGVNNEFSEWAAYNNSVGIDPMHKDHLLDPTRGLQYGVWNSHSQVAQVYWPYPNDRVRVGGSAGQQATINDMRGITSVVDYCSTATVETDDFCSNNLDNFQGNFGSGATSNPLPAGQTLTNLEAFKGEVIADWLDAANKGGRHFFKYSYATNGTEFANDSGSKIYQRDGIGYATPSKSPTIAFGTVGTPAALLNQITQNQVQQGSPTCVDTADAGVWSDNSTTLGRLLQRCQEILPGVTAAQLTTLLNTYNLDLGQYQYIYLPPGSSTLVISQSPPPFLTGLPEFNHPRRHHSRW